MKSVVIKIRLMVFSGRHQFNHQSAQLNHRKLFKAVEHRLQHTNVDHFGPVCNTLYCEVNESAYFVVLSFFKCPKKKSQTSRAGSPVAYHNVKSWQMICFNTARLCQTIANREPKMVLDLVSQAVQGGGGHDSPVGMLWYRLQRRAPGLKASAGNSPTTLLSQTLPDQTNDAEQTGQTMVNSIRESLQTSEWWWRYRWWLPDLLWGGIRAWLDERPAGSPHPVCHHNFAIFFLFQKYSFKIPATKQGGRCWDRATGGSRKVRVFYQRKDPKYTLLLRNFSIVAIYALFERLS